MKKTFTQKQMRFCKEYLVDYNATAAAIRAGYSKRTAAEIGHENLRKPHIANLLKLAQERHAKRNEITTKWVMQRLKSNEVQAREEGNMAQSNRALELMGKHLGMFTPKVQEIHPTTIHVVTGISGGLGSRVEERRENEKKLLNSKSINMDVKNP